MDSTGGFKMQFKKNMDLGPNHCDLLDLNVETHNPAYRIVSEGKEELKFLRRRGYNNSWTEFALVKRGSPPDIVYPRGTKIESLTVCQPNEECDPIFPHHDVPCT